VADPEQAAAAAADQAGLSADDRDDFISGWENGYAANFGGPGGETHGYPSEENQSYAQQLKDADTQLNAVWKSLGPRIQAALRQEQRAWIKKKDAQHGATRLKMILDRIQYLQNKHDHPYVEPSPEEIDLGSQVSAATPTPTPTHAARPTIAAQRFAQGGKQWTPTDSGDPGMIMGGSSAGATYDPSQPPSSSNPIMVMNQFGGESYITSPEQLAAFRAQKQKVQDVAQAGQKAQQQQLQARIEAIKQIVQNPDQADQEVTKPVIE
jgi:hypothetical protein